MPSSVETNVQRIRSAVYGEEVRGSIADSIMSIYHDVATAKNLAGNAAMSGDLVDISSNWVQGKYPHPETCGIWNGENYKYAQEVEIIPGAEYYWTGLFDSACGAWFLDEDGNNITGSGTYSQRFVAPSNAHYVNIGTRGTTLQPKLIMIGEMQREQEQYRQITSNDRITIELDIITGVMNTHGTHNESEGCYAVIDVKPGEEYYVSGYTYNVYYTSGTDSGMLMYPAVFFANTVAGNDTYIRPVPSVTAGEYIKNMHVTVPACADKMYINGHDSIDISVIKKVSDIRDQVRRLAADGPWAGKTIVWFGTSIPAGGFLGYEHPQSYPYLVGEMLGAKVINEAVGSSSIYCKSPNYITSENPRGFGSNFEGTSRCLTNTNDDIQWIIEHANASFWTNKGDYDGSTWWQNKLYEFGFEQKLYKYLTSSNFPDLFVFDHGHNDSYVDRATRIAYNTNYPNDAWQYSYNAGMDFLITRILSYRPDANIVIIGEYTDNLRNGEVPIMQSCVSRDWNIPLVPLWSMLGWTKTRQIQQSGHWHQITGTYDWEWITDSSPSWISVFDRWVPDGIHPHTYPNHVAEKRMAEAIAKALSGRLNYTLPYDAYKEDS